VGVTDVENLGEHRFRLRYDGDDQSVMRIAETCVGNGWGLTGLTVERSSLDTVFATLSQQAKRE
ncbi:MAG: ABC transporter ATP-binding protein, partial [Muribaculaceae bacterium]|nr:ABC transporter ATP-binding protein [Muribaculaceae bacterium]